MERANETELMLEVIFNHALVQNDILVQVSNWTGGPLNKPNSQVKLVMENFAQKVIRKLLANPVSFHMGKKNKEGFEKMADDVWDKINYEELINEEIPLIAKGVKDTLGDIEWSLKDGLFRYSLVTLAHNAAMVANMLYNGLDPQWLFQKEQKLKVKQQSYAELAELGAKVSKSVKITYVEEIRLRKAVNDISDAMMSEVELAKLLKRL